MSGSDGPQRRQVTVELVESGSAASPSSAIASPDFVQLALLQALRKSEESLSLAIQAADLGTWDWDICTDELVSSARALEVFGLPPHAAVDRDRLRQAIHPDDRDRFNDAIRSAISRHDDYYIEMRTVWPDGTVHWLNARGRAYYSDAGEPLRMAGVVRDITEKKLAEEALHSNAKRLELALEAGGAGSFDWDIVNRTGKWSPELQKFYGLEPGASDADLNQWRNWILPEDLPLINSMWTEASRTGEFKGEWRIVRQSDGEIRWLSGRGKVLYDSLGKPVRMVGINVDITEQKKAAEEVKKNRDLLEIFVENAPAALAMFDRNMCYLRASRKWKTRGGFQSDIQGKCHYDLFPNIPKHWKDAHLRGLAGASVSNEEDWIAPDGTTRSVSWSIHPWGDAGVQSGGIIIYSEDVTERKQAERALRDSEAKFRSLFDNSLDAIFLTIPDGSITAANPAACALFGMTEQEFCRAGRNGIVAPNDLRFAAALVDRDREGHSSAEFSFIRKDGSTFEAAVSSVVLDGEPQRSFVVVRDITDRKRAEAALLRSEKLAAVGRMAATIAHEINNPLESVTNILFLVESQADLSESTREYLAMADAELKRIAHITRQSLGFYRESNAPALTSVKAVLESAIDVLKSRIKAKRAVIHKQWDGDVQINAVAGELRQVFSNLLANSLDAIDYGGIIKLRVFTRPSFRSGRPCVRVTVADNGKGISASSGQRLFEPFFTTKGSVGTGLGLWVSKQIIEKHSGSIRMRSSTGGSRRGTVFSILLPVESEAVLHAVTVGD